MENQGQQQQQQQQQHQGLVADPKQSATYMSRFLKDVKQPSYHQQNHLFMKIVMGKFYTQAYRVFKHFPEDNSAILFKRQQSTTSYVLLLVLDGLQCLSEEALRGVGQGAIGKMRALIERIKRRREQHYVVDVVLVRERKKLTFKSQEQYAGFLASCISEDNMAKLAKHITPQPFTHLPPQQPQHHQPPHPLLHYPDIQCFTPYFANQNQQLLFQTREQISNLKQMLTTYIDTFANTSKGTLIYKMIERSSVSFSINMLINTINYIIFQEMSNSCYSQIEPCYWTCYEASKRSLVSDRKHVVLTGAGEVCVLEVIFMREIESEDKKEYDMMLADFKRFYKKAKIKIIRITNQKWDGCAPRINLQDESQNSQLASQKVNNSELIYRFHCTTARQFPSTVQQQQQQR